MIIYDRRPKRGGQNPTLGKMPPKTQPAFILDTGAMYRAVANPSGGPGISPIALLTGIAVVPRCESVLSANLIQ